MMTAIKHERQAEKPKTLSGKWGVSKHTLYLLDSPPALFQEIAARRASNGKCGVCEILSMGVVIS